MWGSLFPQGQDKASHLVPSCSLCVRTQFSLFLSTQGAWTPLGQKFQYHISGPSLSSMGWETLMERQASILRLGSYGAGSGWAEGIT